MKYVVHCKKEKFDIYIGRPGPWGNPFSHKEKSIAEFHVATVEEAIQKYREWIVDQPKLIENLPQLAGKILGCWCAPGPCHGDVLAEMANAKR